MRVHALPQDKGFLMKQNNSIQDACACITPGQRVSYVTEQEHTRCVRMHYPRTKSVLCNRTRAYKMRAHALPRTKGFLCNRTRTYKMRAHVLPQDKECLM